MPKKALKTELLAPAGSFEKLKYAIAYGADAVYAGIPGVSMRARINTFTEKSLAQAAEYVHAHGKKIYMTLNIYAHNYHLENVEKHLKFLKKIHVDGIIVSDPGIILLAKKHLPDVEIHLSTQANTTNWQAAKFWYDLGVTRIVLAREVTLEDVKEIHRRVPKLELEYFVHGAMCMSYSGRCILSKWMMGRSANLGDCSQPCRWAYQKVKSEKLKVESAETLLMEIEDTRGEHKIDLEEDTHGTYFFNSKDLNLLDHVKQLRDAGVVSFKIEGRNKSVYYLATVIKAYRAVLNAINANTDPKILKKIIAKQSKELNDLVHRGYTKGFLLGNEPEHAFSATHQESDYQFVGEVLAVDGKALTVKAHNAIYPNDALEIIGRDGNVKIKVKKIINEKGAQVDSAHGGHNSLYYFEIDKKGIEPLSLIRKSLNN